MRRLAVVVACIVGMLGVPSACFAHGDLEETSPDHGSTVPRPPEEITISLTEPPTRGAEARALDGCKRRVPAAVSVAESDIVLMVEGGEPGPWKVSYRAVSSVDGHQTRGTLAFRVSGKKDCTAGDDEIAAGDNPGIVDNPNPPHEGGNAWLLWVAGGTILAAGAAFLIRRASQ